MELRQALRIGAPVAWSGASVGVVAAVGVPTHHDLIIAWLLLGMVAFSVTAPRRRLARLGLEWAPFAAVLLAYDLLRGIADGLLFPTHELQQIHLEAAVFGTPVPTVWLQQHLWHGPHLMHWWDYLTWLVYLTHFVATLVAAAVLWTFAHDRFARYATMICALAVTGFVTYVLYPAAPPWLAARHHELGRANRIVPLAWHEMPIGSFNTIFERGVHYANNVAAVPSLHAAYALLFSLYLWRLVPRGWRPALALYPFAMTFALVYTAEHYVVDCVLGWIYAIVCFAAVNVIFDRRRAHERPSPAFL